MKLKLEKSKEKYLYFFCSACGRACAGQREQSERVEAPEKNCELSVLRLKFYQHRNISGQREIMSLCLSALSKSLSHTKVKVDHRERVNALLDADIEN